MIGNAIVMAIEFVQCKVSYYDFRCHCSCSCDDKYDFDNLISYHYIRSVISYHIGRTSRGYSGIAKYVCGETPKGPWE